MASTVWITHSKKHSRIYMRTLRPLVMLNYTDRAFSVSRGIIVHEICLTCQLIKTQRSMATVRVRNLSQPLLQSLLQLTQRQTAMMTGCFHKGSSVSFILHMQNRVNWTELSLVAHQQQYNTTGWLDLKLFWMVVTKKIKYACFTPV